MSGVASNWHPDFSTTAPNYLPWGGVRAGAAFFRDEVLPNLPDVLDFGRGFRASAVACRAEIDGTADEIVGADLRADRGPAAQRWQDARGDPRVHGTRLAVGWAWLPGGNREPALGTRAQLGALIAAWIESRAAYPAS
jgi:hypothetical protein